MIHAQSNTGFPKTCRLITPADYNLVFKNTRLKVHTDHLMGLISIAAPKSDKSPKVNHELTKVRLGLAISKKKLKRAVDRNRLKRLVREHHRLNQTMLREQLAQTPQALSLVVVCKKTPPDMQAPLNQEVQRFYERLEKKLAQALSGAM